jgi:hypothetical protein
VGHGGFGIRHAVESTLPCFIASFNCSRSKIQQILPDGYSDPAYDEAICYWKELTACEIPDDSVAGSQSSWEQPIFKKKMEILISESTQNETKARLLASTQPHAGAWLMALPSPQLGTHLTNEIFRISCALRLGTKVCEPHRCKCRKEVDELGLHGLSCKFSSGRHSRHAAANDVIARALQSAEVPSIKEPIGCSRKDGKKPDGMSLVPWKRGKSLIWDFTLRDTFAPSYVSSSSKSPGYAAKLGETIKKGKYKFLENNYIFVPVAMESTGVFGKDGLNLVLEIGRKLAEVTGERRSTSFLIQRLSLAVQRGNAASILGTLPAGRELHEIFNL